MLASNAELARKLKQMEKKYDEQFKIVFEAIRQLMTPPDENKKKKEKNPEHPVYPVKKRFFMTDIASKLRGFCHTRWHDGIDYSDYIEQLPPSKQNNICVYNRYFNIIHGRLVHRYKEIGRMLGKMMSAPENWCGRFGK